MRDSYPIGVKLTLGLEGNGNYTNDPRDPGKETRYGISKRYNPDVDVKNLTLEQAKEIYLKRYWIPAGCDTAPYPMDICLFDSQVNPQNDPKWNHGGNKEIMNLNPESWQDYNLLRMIRYMRNSKRVYVLGHIQRVLKLSETLRRME